MSAASATISRELDVRVLEIAGRSLRVAVRSGDTSLTPLLLLNGIGASLETFNPLIEAMDSRREIIRLDPPGVGGSPATTTPYRFPKLARVVAALLNHLGHDQVDVLGISWGGALAQQFAFTESARCRRLILVATATGALMVPGSPRTLAHLATPRRYRDPGYLLELAPQLYGGSLRTDLAEMLPMLSSFRRGGQPGGYALQMMAGAGWTSVGFLPFLRQRTLVLTGDDDPIIPVANGRILAALIRRATLEIYPGGHVELVAQPRLLAPSIERFLDAP